MEPRTTTLLWFGQGKLYGWRIDLSPGKTWICISTSRGKDGRQGYPAHAALAPSVVPAAVREKAEAFAAEHGATIRWSFPDEGRSTYEEMYGEGA